jgi:hypothetical protein
MFKEMYLYPVWSEEVKDSFVDVKLLAPWNRAYEDTRKDHPSSFLKIGEVIDLDKLLIEPYFGEDPNIQIDYSGIRVETLLARVVGGDQLIQINKMTRLPENRFLPAPTTDKTYLLDIWDFRWAHQVESPFGSKILPFEPNNSRGEYSLKMTLDGATNKIVESVGAPVGFKGHISLEILGYSLEVPFIDTNLFR